jgi:hypothetical protein
MSRTGQIVRFSGLAVLLVALGVIGVGWLLFTLVLPRLIPVENTVRTEAVSPDGRHIATLYERDAGATTDTGTVVSVRPAQARFRGGRNVVFVSPGPTIVTLQWRSPTHLHIAHDPLARVYRQEPRWRGIRITYGAVDAGAPTPAGAAARRR